MRLKNSLLFIFLMLNGAYPQEGWLWQNPLPQGNLLFDVNVFDENTAIAVGGAGTIMKTRDGGDNWDIRHYVAGANTYLSGISFINPDTGWVVGYYGTVLKTTDGGVNWFSQQTDSSYIFSDICFINADSGWGAGCVYGGIYAGRQLVLKTSDGGENWDADSLWDLVAYPFAFNSVFFIDSNHGWVVGYHGTILQTEDGGINWHKQESKTLERLLSVYFHDSTTGYATGHDGTILGTTDSGKTWSEQTSGTSNGLSAVFFCSPDTGWVIGENGTILKTCTGCITSSVEISQTYAGQPNHFKLLQNYPNPFNPSTTIKFQIPNSKFTTLNVYNIIGQKIQTLLNQQMPAGYHKVEFNGQTLASGIYLYRIEAGVWSDIKKMILLR